MPPPGVAERHRPTGLRGAVAIPVVVAALTLACLLAVVPERGVGHFLAEGGWAAKAVLGTFALGLVGLVALAARRASGAPTPVALELGLCVLPWIVGAAGMRMEAVGVFGLTASPDWFEPRAIVTKGISEAMVARTLGAAGTLSLAVGAAATLFARERWRDARRTALDAVLVSTLAVTAAVVVWSSRGISVSLARSISDGGGDPVTGIATASRYLIGGGTCALGIATAGVAASLLSAGRARIGIAAVSLAVIAVGLGADQLLLESFEAAAKHRFPAEGGWRSLHDFEPTAISGVAGSDWFDVLVGSSTIATSTGHAIPWSRPALLDVLRRETAHAERDFPAATFRSLPSIHVALDRRVDGRRLQEIVRTADEAGVSSLALVGRRGSRAEVDRNERALVGAPLFFRLLSDRFAWRSFSLERALLPGHAPPGRPVYVQVTDDTTPDRLAAVTARFAGWPRTVEDPRWILMLVTEPRPGAVVAR